MVDERGAQARTHGAGVTGAIECRYYGRDFTAGEMALLRRADRRAAAVEPPSCCRRSSAGASAGSSPTAASQDMMARVAMLAMHRDGLIALPAPQGRQNRPGPIVFGPDTEAPLFPAPTTLDIGPSARPAPRSCAAPVQSKLAGTSSSPATTISRYKTLVGAQMRYAVHDRDGWPLAMLGFSTAAWKLAPRDNFHRMDTAEAREEPSLRGRQPEIPDPALDQYPQPGFAHPGPHPPAPAR